MNSSTPVHPLFCEKIIFIGIFLISSTSKLSIPVNKYMALFAYKHPWTHCQSKSMLKLLTFSLPRRGSLLSLLFLSSSDSQVKPMVKNPPVNAGDIRDKSSIPGLGRSPGGGHGNPLQNPTDKGAWWVTVHRVAKSRTQLLHLSIACIAQLCSLQCYV